MCFVLGYRQVGKAIDFDSIIRRFKSSYPIQISFYKFNLEGNSVNDLHISTEELAKAILSLKISSQLLNESFIKSPENKELHKALRDSCIQRFEFCVELSWKTSMRVLGLEIKSPNTSIREMARNNLIDNTQTWFNLLDARNKTSHTYDEEIASEVFKITQDSISYFDSLYEKLKNNLK
jgi:nucleotidyltransferase substrate binding protein (TIGR01987 family)